MRIRKQHVTHLSFGILLTLALTFSYAAPAFADSTTATATISGGTLSETSTSSPSISITMNGTDQTATYTVPTTVIDATGTAAGWSVTITATKFWCNVAPCVSPNNVFGGPSSQQNITGVVASCNGGATCTTPTNSISYPMALPTNNPAPAAAKFFNAAANTGMGAFTLTPTVSVPIPANRYAGTYTSTVTLASASGP